MKNPIAALVSVTLSIVAMVASAPGSAQQADPLGLMESTQQRLFELTAPSVVFLSNQQGLGSGFFVTKNGLVLTNAHVVKSSDQVNVVLHDGRKFVGKVVERGANNVDLALVQVPLDNAPVLPTTGLDELRVGSFVASVGHNEGGIWTFNTGMVSNIYPVGSERPVFQSQIPLNPGSSGGPVIDRKGRVVGIVTAGIVNSNSINFSIRMDFAVRQLKLLSDLCECLILEAPAGAILFVDGVMVGTGPKVVVPAVPKTYEVMVSIGGKIKKQTIRYPEKKVIKFE